MRILFFASLIYVAFFSMPINFLPSFLQITPVVPVPKKGSNIRSPGLVLDKITLKYEGRFYLAKDSRLSRKTFEKSDERIRSFQSFRRKKLSKIFNSCQSDRLGL